MLIHFDERLYQKYLKVNLRNVHIIKMGYNSFKKILGPLLLDTGTYARFISLWQSFGKFLSDSFVLSILKTSCSAIPPFFILTVH